MKTVLIYSGGLDSTVLLYELLAAGDVVSPLLFDYGQRHRVELNAALNSLDEADRRYGALLDEVQVCTLPLRTLFAGSDSSQLSSTPVPEGHYADESMKQTVVPNRNMIMLSIAAGYALSIGATRVAYAAHAGDHAIYPDCRPKFVDAMSRAFSLMDWRGMDLHAPYLGQSKTDIVARGVALEVPFGLTWSCYKGGEVHCGLCGTCHERIEAFSLAGVVDPTIYRESGLAD